MYRLLNEHLTSHYARTFLETYEVDSALDSCDIMTDGKVCIGNCTVVQSGHIAAGDVNQPSYSGREVTVFEVWVPLPVGGTAFFRLYAE